MKKLFILLIFHLFTGYYLFAQFEIKNQTKSFMITHSVSQIIDNSHALACNVTTTHATYENSYYRAFDLFNYFNINSDWVVQSVDIGIGLADAAVGNSQSISLKFYTMSVYESSIILDSLTLLGTLPVNILDEYSGQVINFPLSQQITIPKGRILVIEVYVPDYSLEGNIFFIGANNVGQTDNTYIRAPFCGVDNPINVTEILFPDMMMITNVYGEYLDPDPEILSFNIPTQIIETEIVNFPDFKIEIIMPAETELNALTPQILIPAGYTISPASGVTVDFSSGPVNYTVTNEKRKISKTWAVNVLNATPDILSFVLTSQIGDAVITGSPLYAVDISVNEGTDLSILKPIITIYSGFKISPESAQTVDFSSGTVVYTVSHETLPLSQEWTVNVTENVAIKNIVNNEINVFPNPSSGDFTLKLSGNKMISVIDFSGKEIFNQFSNENVTCIDLKNLNNGIYILKVLADNKIYFGKIIISK
jgi:hypothetical protein